MLCDPTPPMMNLTPPGVLGVLGISEASLLAVCALRSPPPGMLKRTLLPEESRDLGEPGLVRID